MRTTLTLDDDVAVALEKMRRNRDIGLKELVNDALRRGIKDMSARPKQREPFQTNSVSLGRLRISNLDNITETLAAAEGEGFR